MPRSFRGYDLLEKIGSGGMSTLYRGLQTALNRPVAVKMLHPGLADDESFIARFEREAKAASQIGHRNIVGVIDFGVEDDVYYIVMELVQGKDLKEILDEVGRIPPEVALTIIEETAFGLEAAHEAQVVHRDIKPSNVMISNTGEVKVADFGLARQGSDVVATSALTMAGTVLGTPAYMSPEQAAGKEVDERSDIFALGVLSYELLTGQKPFAGSTYSEIRDQIINQDPPPPSDKSSITPDIKRLVYRMLEKDPDRRFPSMRHVLRAIEDSIETLDSTGSLFKHKRRYLTKFAQDPSSFADELTKSSVSNHLNQGFFYQQQGLTKITDAIREFEYVLFIDPENDKASSAIHELKQKAEESGVRLPQNTAPADPYHDRGTAELLVSGASEDTPVEPEEDALEGGTQVLGAAPVSEPTQIVSPPATKKKRKAKSGGAPPKPPKQPQATPAKSGGAPAWLRPVGVIAALFVLAFVVFQIFSGGEPAVPSGAILVESSPTGANVSVRGPDDAEFQSRGTTDLTLSELPPGNYDLRFELDGHESEARRVMVGEEQERLSVTLGAVAADGQLTLAVVQEGATVFARRAGIGEFQEIGSAPLAGHTLREGRWDVRVATEGGRQLTQTVEVDADESLSLVWDLDKEFDRGALSVTSDPAGASVYVRSAGTSNWTRTGEKTPATLTDLEVGAWEVQLRMRDHQRSEGAAVVELGGSAQVALTMEAVEATAETPRAGDGFAKLVVSPFADVYLNGRIFAQDVRSTVVPLASGRKHEIELRHPTFGSKFYRDLSVAIGDTLNLGLHRFEFGTVRIYCRPGVPADLLVNGRQLDRQTPFSDKLGAGTHRIQVRKSGWKVVGAKVKQGGGETTLQPNSQGEVEVRVPAKAEIGIEFLLEKDG